ncbi:MAG: ATP-binding protein [Blastocatellia bacterium]|nr:ATP-binding protein [Blastocatellia bacterium]
MTMPERLELTIRNDLAEIARISERIDDFIAGHGLPAKLAFELNLALDELLTNVISYGYDDPGPHDIEVRCALADDVITLEMEDDGRAFDPFDAPPPDLTASIEDRSIGGLGVHLIRNLMTHTEYQRRDGRNVVILKKKTDL